MKNLCAAHVALGALFLSMAAPAFAYLDGATGSMILQALIGGVATAAVFGRMYIAKVKAFFVRGFSRSGSSTDSE